MKRYEVFRMLKICIYYFEINNEIIKYKCEVFLSEKIEIPINIWGVICQLILISFRKETIAKMKLTKRLFG